MKTRLDAAASALLRAGVLGAVCALALPISGEAVAGWDDPRALGNPCANWQEDLRTRRRLKPAEHAVSGRRFLYDGVARLAMPMPQPVALPSSYAGAWQATCVVFEAVFAEHNGELEVAQATPLLEYPPRRADGAVMHQQAAEKVLRQIPFARVLANKPAPGTPELVAVPLWPAHAFFTSNPDQLAGPVVNDLRELGYVDAERIGSADGADVYKVFEERSRNGREFSTIFVVVRALREDEPIVQIKEVPGAQRSEQRAQGPVVEIFERLIAPWMHKQAASAALSIRHLNVEVRHHARGFRVPHDVRNGEAGLGAVADRRTGQWVDHPLLIAYHSAIRHPGEPALQWQHNASPPRYANIAELRQLLAEAHLSKEERVRLAQQAQGKEDAWQAARDRELDAQRQEVHRRVDARNPLASLGYDSAATLFKAANVAYFLAEASSPRHPVVERVVVALHDVGASDPVVELVPAGADSNDVHYAPARIAYVRDQLLPSALARWPDLRGLDVHHHVRGQRLDDTAEFRRKGARAAGYMYDQPLFVESYSQDKGAGPWRPEYETWNRPRLVSMRLSEYARTVAEARALRGELSEAQRFARLSPQERQAALRAQRLKTQAERSPHHVHKSDRFWASLPRFYIPQQVFNGDFGAFQINTQFPAHFRWFLEAYSSHCEPHIPRPRVHRTIITRGVRTDQWGFVTPTGAESRRDIYIEERFWPKYQEYERVIGAAALKDFASILFAGDIAGSPERLLEVNLDRVNETFALAVSWKQFFRDHSCTGPTVAQMRENMLRAATGQASLQAAGERVPNAAAETEPLVPPAGQATVFDGCYQNHEYKDGAFCMCMDTRARRAMQPTEWRRYADDFSLYYSEVVFPDKGGPGDPRWRLYELLRQCKR